MTIITQIMSLWPLYGTIAAAVIWNVRLEGRVNSHASDLKTLHEKAQSNDDTKIEVVRLQEKVQSLTNMLERFLNKQWGME